MATLTAQTKLTCSGINSDDLALDVSMTPTVAAGGIISKTVDVRSGAATEICMKHTTMQVQYLFKKYKYY